MTVYENLAFPLRVRKVEKDEIDKKVDKALSMVSLNGFETRMPAQLSGGQQQRVAVARALVFDPAVVLMDEPLGALDKNLRESMQYEIKHIHESIGVTVVYVTHDQSEALTMSNRIAVFNDGKVQQLSNPAELYEKPVNSFVAEFIGENNTFNGEVVDIAKDKYNVNQHDVSIAPGSTLPTSKWAEYNVYLEAFQLGIVDREEVLKKNPEIFDKEGILQRTGDIQQLQGMVEQLQGQVKNLQGDLQTAQRESVADRKRVEVEKFKSKLTNVETDAKATNKVQAERLAGAVKLAAEKSKNMMGSAQEAGETL